MNKNKDPVIMNQYLASSLLKASLSRERTEDLDTGKELPTYKSLNKLSTVSAFYLYVNPPPMGYGTPAPKVAESVIRAWDFNTNNEKTREIDKYKVNNACIEVGRPYPIDQVTGNYHPGAAYLMYKNMLSKYQPEITSCASKVIEMAFTRNSDILTQGRQSWCPLKQSSLPAAQAYNEMSQFFRTNLGYSSTSCLEWLQMFQRSLNLNSIKAPQIQRKKIKTSKWDNRHMQRVNKVREVRISQEKVLEGEEKWDFLMMTMREFCSYIKHGERGKLKRRAIASAGMNMRMYLYLIEEFHLNLSKSLEGSTISIGGEEKKNKITSTLNSAVLENSLNNYKIQCTQDATKWNECLSAEVFAIMHLAFFSEETREEMRLPLPTDAERLMLKICLYGNFYLAIKSIKLGEGVKGDIEFHHNKIPWSLKNLGRYNERTREWVEKCRGILDEEGQSLNASPGMLMGMHNAASTTLGLGPVMFGQDSMRVKVSTLRSSDDSMTVIIGKEMKDVYRALEIERITMKLVGINLSDKKTWVYKGNFGEYTSWYQDGVFVAQYGVETSTLRPQGKNPSDDFHSIAKGCQVSQINLEMNPIGATAKLRIGTDNVRRLWRVEFDPAKREGISPMVQLMADGGYCPWDSMNCHLEETSIKMHHARNDVEREYLLRIRNPENPFVPDASEEVAFSKETNTLTMITPETPRTVFHYIKRANRAITNQTGKTHADKEKAYTQLVRAINTCDASTILRIPNVRLSMSDYMLRVMDMEASSLEFTPEERQQLEQARGILSGDLDPADIDGLEEFSSLFPED